METKETQQKPTMADVINRVITLLTQQNQLYGQLRELAKKQGEYVDGNNPETLLKILAARQRIIDRLTVIDRELQPVRKDWDVIAKSMTEEQRTESQRLIKDVQETLASIISSDEKDFQALTVKKEIVAGQIRGAAKGKRVNQAYGQASAMNNSRYLDAKSC